MPQRISAKQKILDSHPQDTSYIGEFLNSNLNQNKIPDHPSNQSQFYEEYKRVLGISHQIKKQFHQQKSLKEQLIHKIDDLEKVMQQSKINKLQKDSESQNIKKRNRRMAQQIERKHKCEVQYCEKQYGSEGSLLQHIKLKHPQIYMNKF